MTGSNGHGSTLDKALAYARAGLSVIPIRRDGSKRPTCRWEPYQQEPADEGQIRRWYASDEPPGIAIIGGDVSGGLECLDFNAQAETIYPVWCELVEVEAPGLIDRLSVAHTPKAGYHVRYRCPDVTIDGNTKLAQEPVLSAATGRMTSVTLIETRGEGGYALAPGCPAECHPTGRLYEHHSGPHLESVQAIGFAERDILIRCARSFDRSPPPEATKPKAGRGASLSPGDDYDQRGPDWPAILEPHGWEAVHRRGEVTYWKRPHKDGRGWSATTGVCISKAGRELFYVFSSNAAPFESERGYSKFAVYALLNHGGDFGAAAKALAAEGYGEQRGRPSSNGTASGHTASGQAPEQDDKPPGDPHTERQTARLATTALTDIKPEPIHWLVPNFLPLGKLVMLAGDGGHGKSSITLNLTADLTRGLPCFGLDRAPQLPCEVLLIGCEDDYGDTVVPRLLAAGADLSHVFKVDGVRDRNGKVQPFSLAHYQAMEEELKRRPKVRLVVIDPAGAYIGRSGVDDHKDSELRSLLDPLAELAAKYRVTVLLVKHLNKGATAKAIHRVSGSTGYINAVRAAFVVAPSQEDEALKLILPLKFNIAKKPVGLSYRLDALSPDEAERLLKSFAHLGDEDRARLTEQLFRVTWLGPVSTDADSLFAAAAKGAKDKNKVAKCVEWLETFLKTHAYPSDEIVKAAKAEGFTFDNVKEAKVRLKEKGLRNTNRGRFQGVWWSGFGEPDSWVMRPLTPHTPESPESPHNGDCEPATPLTPDSPDTPRSPESPHYGDVDPSFLPHPSILHPPDP